MLAATLIVFREMLEAGLIVGIVLAAVRGVPGSARMVCMGVAAGVAGACLLAAFAGQLGALFDGNGQELFQAAVLLGAVVMLAWHTIWMASHGRAMTQELRAVGRQVRAGDRPLTALGIVVAIAVLREGSEVVLFLYGIAAAGGTSAAGMTAGGAVGVLAGAAVSALIYFGLLAVPAGRLLSVTGWMITLLAAGMASQAIAFLQQAGFGEQYSDPLWNTGWLLHEDSIAGRLAHTLIGYTEQPDILQLGAYVLTLVVIWALARAVSPRRPPAPLAAE